MNQSEWYESWGDMFYSMGEYDNSERCYRAAQTHILVDNEFNTNFKRIQQKIVLISEQQIGKGVCV